MKLNHDCVRDLLLYLEENLDNKNIIDITTATLGEYNKGDLIYTAQKLIEAGFINGKSISASNDIYSLPVNAITFNGHQFLDTIRPRDVWEKTIESAKKIGSTSLAALSEIAIKIAVSMIMK